MITSNEETTGDTETLPESIPPAENTERSIGEEDMVSEDDWRLTDQIDYMKGIKLKRALFPEDSKSDHEHCEFCWEKFYTDDASLKDGYCTLDGYRWVCNECFEDFKGMFEWEVEVAE